MKLATIPSDRPDGELIVVSRDLRQAVRAPGIAGTMLDAIERWQCVRADLEALSRELEAGRCAQAFAFDPTTCLAPLPRTWQWLDASAFLHHGRLMERVFRTPPIADFETIPLMYQGASDDLLGPCADVALPDEAHDIDFEGEFGVVVDDVPMGVGADEALRHVVLCVQINDWSLRAFGQREMRSGFGFVHAKPATSFAPVAVTPEALGGAWRGGRIELALGVEWNGRRVGAPVGSEMHFHFGQLIAHAAATRRLRAGTIIGSGTISNASEAAGSACIAELRMLEILHRGAAQTGYLRFGDRVRMQACDLSDGSTPFGAIDQQVVLAA